MIKILITLYLLSCHLLFSQQLIGSFPEMNGGLEGETGVLEGISSIDTTYEHWTTQFPSRGTISLTGGRSGPAYVTFTHDSSESSTTARLQTPTSLLDTSTSYVVQFYYQGNFDMGDTSSVDSLKSRIRGGVSWSSVVPPLYGNSHLGADTGPAWTKYTAVITTADSGTPDFSVGIVSVRYNVEFYIDDFVIYESSTVDTTSPDDPLSPIAMKTDSIDELMIFWDPPATGVDSGGYLVTRSTDSLSSVSATPLVNGIYALGNLIDSAEVVYIGTETSFFDQGLIPDTFYYYRVYTVDKAFNYSGGVTTTGETPLPVELGTFTASRIGNTVELKWSTITELNNYGFEVQRSINNIDWLNIGFVAGTGNSTETHYYDFLDKKSDKKERNYYRLKQIDFDGTVEYSNILEINADNTVEEYSLNQNYPNPFNPATVIDFSLPVESLIKIKLFNLLGEEIKELVSGEYPPGQHKIEFTATNLSSGVYLYTIEAVGKNGTSFTNTKKMTLIK